MLSISSPQPTIEDITRAFAMVREADMLTARALRILGSADVEAATGLSAEMALMFDARRTAAEARTLTQAATTLRAMPFTEAAFGRGDLAFGQVRAICASVKQVYMRGREDVDTLIGSLASTLRGAEPDLLVNRVDDAVATLRADLTLRKEDRAIESNFLAVQGRLDGSATFYGEADAASAATILEALDAAADLPVSVEEADAPSRARQRMEALVVISEASLNGGHSQTTRPRPRLIASIDIDAFAREGLSEGARVLWSLVGRAPRLSGVATEALLCDASITPVYFQGARPIHVGDATDQITTKQRSALIARDGGCRFPGCGAPVSWCDAHHVKARIHDGPTIIDNLILLCRRCHRRVHRYGWKVTFERDGTLSFTRRGKIYPSHPRGRPPSRE